MTSVLLVTSSPRGRDSHSTRIATQLAESLHTGPSETLVRRDLAQDALPHIGADFAAGIGTPAEARSAAQSRAVAASDRAVDELFAADALVIAAGMINFSVPSTLKAWLDHIARAGLTFRYGENGPEGLVKGKKVYLVVASGGVYSQGEEAAFDHVVPYLTTILGFMGMSDVEVIRIEGVALGGEVQERALSHAQRRLADYTAAA